MILLGTALPPQSEGSSHSWTGIVSILKYLMALFYGAVSGELKGNCGIKFEDESE